MSESCFSKYSPDAIIGEIKRDGLFEGVCTKTLYNWLRKELFRGFEMIPKRRKERHLKRSVGYKNVYAKRIEERPKEADDREAGHWEMDTVVGHGDKACLLVLTKEE